MALEESWSTNNVILFQRKTKKEFNTETVKKVENIIESKWYNWSKFDIIWILLSNSSSYTDENLASQMLSEDYNELYIEVIEEICKIWDNLYSERGYTFKYDEKTRLIYFIESDSDSFDKSDKIDISLVPNKDYSFTNLEVFYKWELMFMISENGFAVAWYDSNIDDDNLDDDNLDDDEWYYNILWKLEKSHIDSMNIDRDNLIAAISCNFWSYILNSWKELSHLDENWKYFLLDLLTEMIFLFYWWKYKLIIEPFSKLYLQTVVKNWDWEYLQNLIYDFEYDEETWNTDICLYDWNSKILRINW